MKSSKRSISVQLSSPAGPQTGIVAPASPRNDTSNRSPPMSRSVWADAVGASGSGWVWVMAKAYRRWPGEVGGVLGSLFGGGDIAAAWPARGGSMEPLMIEVALNEGADRTVNGNVP